LNLSAPQTSPPTDLGFYTEGETLSPQTAWVFAPLWEQDARFLGAFGGRGSGKSNDRAQAVIINMLTKPGCRVVGIREVQNSLKDSVKQLLIDWIERMGVRNQFTVLVDEVRGPGNSLCIFRGMNDQNSESIKSLEGFDIAWIEEAQTISQRSLDLLRPTIRKPGSQIWATWNPRFKTDPIDIFLRQNPPESAVVVEANYSDNPWFPDVLEIERLIDKSGDPERYGHIWLGRYEKVGDRQLIPAGVVEDARKAEAIPNKFDELILGVDVARFGSDETVIAFRRGRDARTIPWQHYKGLDTMEVASRVAAAMDAYGPDAVFIDSGAMGAGVVDRLRQLRREVIPVDFGSKASGLTNAKTANKRAEMWVRMRDWLMQGRVAVPDDPRLELQMTGIEYSHDQNNAILLERKHSERRMRAGLPSPDRADALALTFAYPVSKRGYDDDEHEETARGRSEATGY